MPVFSTEALCIVISDTGEIVSFLDVENQKEHLASGHPAPLLQLGYEDRVEAPRQLQHDAANGRLSLVYPNALAIVEVAVHGTHVTFTLRQIMGSRPVVAMWGPYPTVIRDTVGETVGVVRSDEFALGIQALNMQTIGGWPEEYSSLGYADHDRGEARYAYHECAASRTDWGSVLQAYVRDRSRGRVARVWGIDNVVVTPMIGPEACMEGSRIALFGCPEAATLDTIGAIELAEGLPHPLHDGEWVKKARRTTEAYLITSFSEANLQEVLGYAQQAGLRYVYHEGPFATWGHFQLKSEEFPDGDESLRRCVDRAEEEGIRLGLHTLSNFTTTNDPYVTPVPDGRLQCTGGSVLSTDINAATTEIPVEDPTAFFDGQWLSTVMIGQELVQYAGVSERSPWRLVGCRRGAFGTTPTEHQKGTRIGKLWDHSYRVLFPSIHMQDEYTARLVDLFNYTGLRQISFDGLEGCWASGHGDFAVNRFVQKCYAGWQQDVISDASILNHFTWHMHYRMNWGEPWGAAMREGMPEYRFSNQRYFHRNLFPRMLGWFLYRRASSDFSATSLDDIEWMLAKCAGFDAGFALVASLETLRHNGATPAILAAVRNWEFARLSGAFTPEQRKKLAAAQTEWHLEPASEEGTWHLREVSFSKQYTCMPQELQPGQPGGADWPAVNSMTEQPLRFRLYVGPGEQGSVQDPAFSIGGQHVVYRVELQPGQYLVCDGEAAGMVHDADWNLLQKVPASVPPIVPAGHHVVSFSCAFLGGCQSRVNVRFVTMSQPELVKKTI